MELAVLLQELVELTIEICENWKREGKIRKEQKVYIKHKVNNFEYKESGVSFSGSFSTIRKDEWNSSDIFKLLDFLEDTPPFKNCIKAVAEIYNVNEAKAEFRLSTFVKRALINFLEGDLDSKAIISLITTFINDLEGNPIKWKIETWIEGIFMETESIEIEKGIIIRRPKAEDFEYEYEYEYPLIEPMLHRSIEYPSAILEIRKRIKFQPFVYPELEKLLLSLQLYKLGTIRVIQTKWKPKSILQFGGISRPILHWATTYKYVLTENDKKSLPRFVGDIKDKLPVEEETGRPLPSHPIGIAILRYQDAISKPEPIENKVAYAIMGLEALYLKAEEKQELSRRLAQRVAKVMGILEDSSIDVYKTVKKGYGIRSKFVHGSISRNETRKDLLDKIVEYLRKSILILLMIPKGKDEFIQLIDDAMLDDSTKEKLEQLIRGGISSLGLLNEPEKSIEEI